MPSTLPSGRPSRRSRKPRKTPIRAALRCITLAALALVGLASGCSLGNVTHDACGQTSECGALFGVGSECLEGYCTDPKKCATDADCTQGTCRGGFCSVGSCEGTIGGKPCYACAPEKREEFLNACTDATCVPFDPARVTKIKPGDPLPPVP
jgi:hypothetical protein